MTSVEILSQGGADAPADPDEVREDFEEAELEDDFDDEADGDDA